MPTSFGLKLVEAYRQDFRIYYRVFVDGVEKPRLVYLHLSDHVRYGESALQEWCRHNLDKLASGTIVEAKFSETGDVGGPRKFN